MDIKDIITQYKTHPQHEAVVGHLEKKGLVRLALKALSGSGLAMFAAAVLQEVQKTMLFILPDKEEAAYFYNDLFNLLPNKQILFFPSSYKRSIKYGKTDEMGIIQRTEVLNKLASKNRNLIIISYPEALAEKVISKKNLSQKTFEVKAGETVSTDFIQEILEEYHFEQVDFVYEPGQYAIRGSILDVFSFSSDYPYRIDFFGDTIESIRSFDISTQLSKAKYKKITIVPNLQEATQEDKRISLLEFMAQNTVIWTKDTTVISKQLDALYDDTDFQEAHNNIPGKENIMFSGREFEKQLAGFCLVENSPQPLFSDSSMCYFNMVPQPAFNKKFDLLGDNLQKHQDKGYQTFIFSNNPKQIERLMAIFEDINHDVQFTPVMKVIHEGFIDHDLKICFYTDHQLFERYHRYQLKKGFAKKEAATISDINNLHPGDYVVHVDHGIGKFGGMEKIEVNGKYQECIKLLYKDNDILYVSIHSLHRISKYKGKDATPPRIYKLGSGAWQKLKQKTKKNVKDIARELIALYAKRKTAGGFAFSKDNYLQNELEASFIYEDTPDQLKATKALKDNMESAQPMDMLVCGDVGFGKTEVAVRAAFKAVNDNKQVAVLVPTTILALQHYHTFKERLKGFPCNIDHLSRLKNTKDQKKTLQNLREGMLDIVIGTHRLVSKDIKFNDLGLMIIDEEQKFGVAVKEKLKNIKVNVDTLSLTATPIPRTLQFSLLGVRDLAVINTAPPNRYPIITELHSFNPDIIKEAIEYEVNRNGQVFFIHNRIHNIEEMQHFINSLCPGITSAVAHGQMNSTELENTMTGFINGDFDVLIATNIIESGLDIPNANTIIINNAHYYGLSDLHQLRGRVGRSNKKAFCYLLAPPATVQTPEARRRLKAIEEFSELGSGFNIAMQDLDIRGAGNLLGAEQTGFISDIGFETYHRILNEAVQELKTEEFKKTFEDEKKSSKPTTNIQDNYIDDCQIDTDIPLMFPEAYINNIPERLRLYRRLNNIKNEEEIKQFEAMLTDRFGPLPEKSKNLLNIVRMRWKAVELGFEKIIIKNNKMVIHFVSDQDSPYYHSETFQKIIGFVQGQSKQFKMKEKNEKLTLSVDHINDLQDVLQLLDQISDYLIRHADER